MRIGLTLSCLALMGCATKTTETLPQYAAPNNPVLHKKAQRLSFPLTKEDRHAIAALDAKYNAEKNCAGLAAPQIGIDKAVIIFEVPNDPLLKKHRKDLTDTMPKTLWINPAYTPIGTKKTQDWESCFSVPDKAGLVPRYTNIRYTAYAINGKEITGKANGFLARVIQHETDHIDGILYINKAIKVMSKADYIAMRKKNMGEQMTPLPNYVPDDNPVHRQKAQILTFPLTPEDLQAVEALKTRFNAQDKNCVGLAATQIGIGKAIVIISVPTRHRKDVFDIMPTTVWINPSCKPIGSETTGDWEGCYTIPDRMSYVKRHRKIEYTAYTVDGKKVTGKAVGYLARVIQHEVDRINGIIYADKAVKSMPKEAYFNMKAR